MSCGADAARLLEAALLAQADRAGCPITLATGDWTRWASATFTGARHRIELTAQATPEFHHWLAGLAEAEFDLRGQLVADLVVAGVHSDGEVATAELEALTVEAR